MSDMYFLPFRPAYDGAGLTVPGSQHYFTVSDGGTGGEVPSAPFADAALTIRLSNPVVADGIGKLPPVYLDAAVQYRVRIYGRTAVAGVDTPLEEYAPYIPGVGDGTESGLRGELAASSGGSLIAYIATGAGAVSRTVEDRLRDFVSVKDFGATGDGVTDDRAAVQAAIDAVSAAGGGTVYFPRGTYVVGKYPTEAACLLVPSNITIMGAGRGATVIKRAANSSTGSVGAHVISFLAGSEVAVRSLTVDGNRDNNTTSGHGIRFADMDGGTVDDLLIRNTYSYGIGCQEGSFKRLKISNVSIQDTGADGIDIKNRAEATLNYDGGTIAFAVGDIVTGATSGASGTVTGVTGNTAAGSITMVDLASITVGELAPITNFIDNENLQVGGVTRAIANGTLARLTDNQEMQLVNVSVRRWGLRTDLTQQAGIDIRGPMRLTNIWISEPSADSDVGIRMRQGEVLDANGYGGHEVTLTNFDIRMGTGANQFGVNTVARNVVLTGGRVSGGLYGLYLQDSGGRVQGVTVTGASSDGVRVYNSGGLVASKTVLSGVRSTSNGGDGFEIQASNCALIACQAESNTGYGANITSTATLTDISGGTYASNTAGQINDAGATTTIRAVNGVADKRAGQLLSGTYTPTLTNIANIDVSTPAISFWSRVDNIVTVSGGMVIDPTASGATTQLQMTLPVATTFSGSGQAAGSAVSTAGGAQSFAVNSVSGTGLAQITGTSTVATSTTMNFTFSYRVM